ncbi:MAG: organic hydroperoxide resistance protein [Xanthomonadales bacterium]|jgi:Ohr subfamily peroxiredoxin|nr:organic hydroperoxide resistance protein [Xanthomonadales bacterium]
MSLTIMHTTSATASGGRNGQTRSADGVVDFSLSVPKAMGGPGKAGTTTPEDLFAAGYAACFGSAAEFMSRQMKLSPSSLTVHCEVGVGMRAAGGFGLAVKMVATVGGLSQEDAERLIEAGHKVCPYSNAIHGNVPIEIVVQVA